MKHLDLFSGIGGFAYAAQEVWGDDYECVGFCEIDRYCQELLKIRFPGVKIYDDIKKLTAERITTATDNRRPQKCKKQTAGNKQYYIDLLTGGFPCQPFSAAGKRKGTEDDRHLWPQMLRVIKEVNPKWIIAENVYGLVNIKNVGEQGGEGVSMDGETDNESGEGEFDDTDGTLWTICNDLEQAGYKFQIFIIPAAAVGAPHRRDRMWIVAHAGHGNGTWNEKQGEYEKKE